MHEHKKFQQFNQLPQDDELKRKIYEQITAKNTRTQMLGLSLWKELTLIAAICSIGFFLFLLPSISKNQATTSEIQGIYSYYSSNDDHFKGRASTLYLGVKNSTSERMVLLFNALEELAPIEARPLEKTRYDIVVVKNGEPYRYQLTANYLVDLESRKFYSGYDDFPLAIYEELDAAHNNHSFSNLFVVFPLLLLAVHISAWTYYSRRKLQPPEKVKGSPLFVLVLFAFIVGFNYYSATTGALLYIPYVIAFLIGLSAIQWVLIRRHVTDLHVWKIERLKIIVLLILLIAGLLTFSL